MNQPQPVAPEKIKTKEDANQALFELSWLAHERDIRQARCQQELDQLKARQADQFVVRVNGQLISVTERYSAVEEQLAVWCEKNLSAHLTDEKKSIDLPHGTLGFQSTPLKVDYQDGANEKTVLEKLDRKTDLFKLLNDLTAKVFGGHVLSMFIKVKVSLSLTDILKAVKVHRLTETYLKSLGLKVCQSEEAPQIKPAKYCVDATATT